LQLTFRVHVEAIRVAGYTYSWFSPALANEKAVVHLQRFTRFTTEITEKTFCPLLGVLGVLGG